jgi:cold shock CspA family protein
MRRLFTLASKTMLTAAGAQSPRVDKSVVFDRLAAIGGELLERHTTAEHNQITSISEVCRQTRTYLFSSEVDAQSLLKPFLSKTQQDSVLTLSEHGPSGRLVYEFDYAYCVAYGLPTHVHVDTHVSCTARTLDHASWTNVVADMTDTVLRLSGLTRGVIVRYRRDKRYGFIMYSSDEDEVFFHADDIIDWAGYTEASLPHRRVRFALGDSPKGPKARSVVIEKDGDSGRIRFG